MPQPEWTKLEDKEAWRIEIQELLFEDLEYWTSMCYKASNNSSDCKDLMNSSKTHIALTYLHKLIL
ncbi:MAG: hypothetical protein RLO03_13975 [Balneola sp.]